MGGRDARASRGPARDGSKAGAAWSESVRLGDPRASPLTAKRRTGAIAVAIAREFGYSPARGRRSRRYQMGETVRKSLAGVALLAELPPERLAELERSCRWRRYAAKELIFDLESEGTEIYFVVDGAVQVVNYSPSGREIAFAQASAGSYIGELSAIDRRPRSATVVAAEDTTLASISAATFQKLLLEHPNIALLVLHNLAQMVRAADERIMDLSTLSAINRVHTELLRVVSVDGPDANTGYIRPIPTHSDIASRASTSRETVSRVLSHLARVRILERAPGELRVLDVERLNHLIEPAGD